MADDWNQLPAAPADTPKPAYQPGQYPRVEVYRQPTSNVPSEGDPWSKLKSIGNTPPEPMSGPTADAIATNGSQSGILNAFGQGFEDRWGAATFMPELKQMMADHGILYDPATGKEPTAAQAFNEAWLRPAANALDVAFRTAAGVGQGIHDASIEAGHPFDAIAASMDAFPLLGAELGRLGWLPGSLPKPIAEAQEVGVVGKELKSISEGTPYEAAQTLPAKQKADVIASNPMDQTITDAEFNQRVSTLEMPDDVRKLIEAATEHEPFQPARQGEIPPAHLGRLSEITGIPVDQLPEAKMRLRMNGDKQYAAAGQILIQAQDNVFNAARTHSATKSFETRQALVETIMRRDLALEQIVGLNGEWGRTGNAIQDLYNDVKSAQDLGRFIKDRKGEGWNSEKIDQIADDLSKINSREGVGRYLTETRRPDFLDKAIWYWTNSILSGVITHTKYIFANAAYIAHDTLVATPLAGVSGAVRQALSKEEIDRVYMGETAAKVYGLIAGVPDALMAAGKAVVNNSPTALEAQLRGESNINPITQLAPVGGRFGQVMSVPSRSISGIHSFFNFLGYRAEIEAQAYRRAVKDGYKPSTREFWRAQADHASYPDDPMMDASIEAGRRANFVQDLPPTGKKLQSLLYQSRIGRFIIPFTMVPINIARAVQEGTPAAYLDPTMRKALTGTGASKDMAIGRLTAGAAVMGAIAYKVLGDKITGNGPIDPKQRAEWLLTHQPRSYQQNGVWKSYDRFGPAGGWISLSADLTDTTKDIDAALADGRMTPTEAAKANADLEEGYARAVTGFTHWFEESGFQGVSDFFSELNDPQKTRISNFGSLAATALPYSSFNSQAASFFDPHMRETQTFLDGIKRTIPGLRETLPVVRDWSGQARPNPMYHSLVKNQPTNSDPVDLEMQRLDHKPSRVEDQIKGVKLTPEEYDLYQSLAGAATRSALEQMIKQPSWQTFPDYAKDRIIDTLIKNSRAQAEATMLMQPGMRILNEAKSNKLQDIAGQKHKPTAYERPGN